MNKVGVHNNGTADALALLLSKGPIIDIPEGVGMLDVLGIPKDFHTRQRFRNYLNSLEARGDIHLDRYTANGRPKIAQIRVVKAANPVIAAKEANERQIIEKVIFDAKFPDFNLSEIPAITEYMTKKIRVENHVNALKELGVEVIYEFIPDAMAEEGIKLYEYCMKLIGSVKEQLADATMQLQSVVMQRDNLEIENIDAKARLANWYADTPINGAAPSDTKGRKSSRSVDSSASDGHSTRVPNQNERPVVS